MLQVVLLITSCYDNIGSFPPETCELGQTTWLCVRSMLALVVFKEFGSRLLESASAFFHLHQAALLPRLLPKMSPHVLTTDDISSPLEHILTPSWCIWVLSPQVMLILHRTQSFIAVAPAKATKDSLQNA